MKKFSQVRKKLFVGLVVLFLSMTIIPITGSLPIEKEQSKMFFGIDMTPPYVSITFPYPGFLYIENRAVMKFFTTFIIGTIGVSVKATDNQSGVNRVEFYLEGVLKANVTKAPYIWKWSEHGFLFPYTLKVIAYDNAGNHNSTEMKAWKLF